MVVKAVISYALLVSLHMASSGGSAAISDAEGRWRAYLAGIQARDPESLTRLYDESARVLFGLALRVVADPADAEEVILDVFHRVWNTVDGYDATRGTVWGWLTVMTRNRAIDRLRQAITRRSREMPMESGREPVTSCPENESILREERRLVRHAVATLAADQREAIELAFFRGLTHMEVAEALGEPLGTIKSRIRVGMKKLRETLPAGAF
jgi:RNA polymerase sigma-70 factor (ECF subfamily)